MNITKKKVFDFYLLIILIGFHYMFFHEFTHVYQVLRVNGTLIEVSILGISDFNPELGYTYDNLTLGYVKWYPDGETVVDKSNWETQADFMGLIGICFGIIIFVIVT